MGSGVIRSNNCLSYSHPLTYSPGNISVLLAHEKEAKALPFEPRRYLVIKPLFYRNTLER